MKSTSSEIEFDGRLASTGEEVEFEENNTTATVAVEFKLEEPTNG